MTGNDYATVAAVDLGASSGRVMLARVGPGRLDLVEVHRFGNVAVPLPGGLHWNAVGLFAEILTGLRALRGHLTDGEQLDAVGIDTWAVDYGLVDAGGELLGVPYSYRDGRTAAGVARVHDVVSREELYARNGLQFMPFNTLYQLAAEQHTPRRDAATAVLLLPDLFGFWLTGAVGAEITNASTTGLLDPRERTWDVDLAARLGIPAALLPPLRRPGDVVGTLLPHIAEATGLPPSTRVIAVGSHDTASAVVAVPAADPDVVFVSSGTWSLVGVELAEPVLTEASRAANYTNEGGVDERVRYLRNVMGLWLLTESLRTWNADRDEPDVDLAAVLDAAAKVPAGGPVFDPDDPVFLPPGDMPARIAAACRALGQPPPVGHAAVVRCILDSLAAAYARAVADIRRLAGRDPSAVHIVGGGSRNALLCRLTAAVTRLPVLAGPVEATALGNVLVQARALGAVTGDLAALRALVRDTQPLIRYLPDGDDGVPLSIEDRPDRQPLEAL
jgi:rhamnulokinase